MKVPAPKIKKVYHPADYDLYAAALACKDAGELYKLLSELTIRGHSQEYWDKLSRIVEEEQKS